MESSEFLQATTAAANSGSADAQYQYATMLRVGDLIDRDLEKSRLWYEKAAKQGHCLAQNDLGSMFFNGMGGPKDGPQALHWYLLAAEGGCADAQFNVAQRYLHGDFVEPDDSQSFLWAWRAAQQDHVEATTMIGTAYRFGRGIEQDILQASRFHLIGARNGDPVAHGNLADYSDDIEQLALAGNPIAMLEMAIIHAEGLGREIDRLAAKAWIDLLDNLDGANFNFDDEADRQLLAVQLDSELTAADRTSADQILARLKDRIAATGRELHAS